ncbi:MAG: phospho-N-acetylmuramoyl-pentapeptide-transferase [Sumerlaeia bacterium]
MIPWLADVLGSESDSFFRIGTYITVRFAAALFTAFLLCLLFGPWAIAGLRRLKFGQPVRDSQGENAVSLLDMHASKVGTPTMGGLLMVAAMLVAVLFFGDLRSPALLLGLFAAVGYGAIGFADDWLKVSKKNFAGLSARGKLLAQGAIGLVFGAICVYLLTGNTVYEHGQTGGGDLVALPFFKDAFFRLGILYLPFAAFVLMATSNAVNLTDGLDGLASGVTLTVALSLAVAAYLVGRVDASAYLLIPHVEGAGELSVLLAALSGACLGFLWFNAPPAKVFMGDTGSMMIGGLLGAVALLIKQEFLLVVAGGVFVAEALSVMIQVSSYKLRKKRVFLMSPLHHHYEKLGIAESQIIVRFWIISLLLSLAALSILKLR